jgi:ParB-like chromosome segregation protein Spo0J
MTDAHLRGEVHVLPLALVQPNGWNPNVCPPHVQASIEHGFRTDGWLVSQALLVWGKDDKGKDRHLIIDGEHRHAAGLAVGLEEGPMVVLDGLTEVEAKALTIKMNQRRGDWDPDLLGNLLRDLEDMGAPVDALDMGFDNEALAALMAGAAQEVDPMAAPGASLATDAADAGGAAMSSVGQNVKTVQLVFGDAEHGEFVNRVRALQKARGESVAAKVLLDVVRAATPGWTPV